jgi:hypothetical protein
MAFIYESGYTSHFGIPTYFIKPDMPHIIKASASVAFVAGLTIVFIAAIRDSLRHNNSKTGTAFALIMLYCIIPFALLSIKLPLYAFYFLIAALLLLPVTSLYGDLLLKLPGGRFLDKFCVSYAKEMREHQEDLDETGYYRENYLPNIMGILFICLISSYAVYVMGRQSAEEQVIYHSINDSNTVILRIYGSRYITVDINRKDNTFNNQYGVIYPNTGDTYLFNPEHVGPLKQAASRKNTNKALNTDSAKSAAPVS